MTPEPPVEKMWPAPARYLEIRPDKPVKFTLTAPSEDGQTDVRPIDMGAKAIDTEAAPGRLHKESCCLTDYPKTTTTYKIVEVGGDNQRDRGSVTVRIR